MKELIRKEILNKRKNIEFKEQKGLRIINHLKSIINDFNNIMIYYPISNEPNILNIMENNKNYYLPYCINGDIEVRKIVSLDDLEKDEANVLSSKVKTNDMIEVVIVPAVAMNRQFFRLGYGKGYYDRFLKYKNVLKIAVVYNDFLIDEQYQDEWDVCFDYIVTEKEIIKKEI